MALDDERGQGRQFFNPVLNARRYDARLWWKLGLLSQ
jgi:hypothetical protein